MAGRIKVAAWGGNGGSPWDLGPVDRIIKIKVYHGAAIFGLDITYVLGGNTQTVHYGGSEGETAEINIGEGEYITAISGYVNRWNGVPKVVTQLTIVTGKGATYSYGVSGGTAFSLRLEEGKIVGFHGRAGAAIDAIGVYLAPN